MPVKSVVRPSRAAESAKEPQVDVNVAGQAPSRQDAGSQESRTDPVSLRTVTLPRRRAGTFLWLALGVTIGVGLASTLWISGGRPVATWLANSARHSYAAAKVAVHQAPGLVGAHGARAATAAPFAKLIVAPRLPAPAAPGTPATVSSPTEGTSTNLPSEPPVVRTNAVKTQRRVLVDGRTTRSAVQPSASATESPPLHSMTIRQPDAIDTHNPY